MTTKMAKKGWGKPLLQTSPTSLLGERWFRTFVPILILSTLSSNFLYHPYQLPPTSLEEWFTPPPTSSPGSKIVVPNAAVGTQMRLFSHLGRHRFFIIFQHLFSSILAPSWLPKWLPNLLKVNKKSIQKKSIQKLHRKTYYFWGRFFIDF